MQLELPGFSGCIITYLTLAKALCNADLPYFCDLKMSAVTVMLRDSSDTFAYIGCKER